MFQVTGGSSGIGKAVAIKSAKLGANVTILARNKVSAEKMSQVSRKSSSGFQTRSDAYLAVQPLEMATA